MTEKKKVQVFIDEALAQQIKDNFADNQSTSITWVFTQLGQQLVRGMISLQALNPLKDKDNSNSTK